MVPQSPAFTPAFQPTRVDEMLQAETEKQVTEPVVFVAPPHRTPHHPCSRLPSSAADFQEPGVTSAIATTHVVQTFHPIAKGAMGQVVRDGGGLTGQTELGTGDPDHPECTVTLDQVDGPVRPGSGQSWDSTGSNDMKPTVNLCQNPEWGSVV